MVARFLWLQIGGVQSIRAIVQISRYASIAHDRRRRQLRSAYAKAEGLPSF